MKNILRVGTLVMSLCYFSVLWADETKPKAFEAVAGDRVVHLYWSPPKSQVKGYWVYRAIPNGNYQRVNSVLLEKPFYEDRDVVNGQFYWYTLTAIIDHEGNEGTASKELAARPTLRHGPSTGY